MFRLLILGLFLAIIPSTGPSQEPNDEVREKYFGVWYATDSASAATAMSTGTKTDEGNIAWAAGDPADGKLTTIAEKLRVEKGFAIGVTSTVPFNHATPAAFVSHNVSRENYIAIATEIITQVKPEVVIGGGHHAFGGAKYTNADIVKLIPASGYTLVERKAGADGVAGLRTAASTINVNTGGRLFGLFGGSVGNFDFHVASDTPSAPLVTRGSIENPTMADSVVAAIDVLSDDKDGFFAMFEQGDIDWSNHANDYENMIGGVWDLDRAVRAAEDIVNNGKFGLTWENTLVILTADHSNSYMKLNGRKKLGLGDLPAQAFVDKNNNGRVDDGEWAYADGDVVYTMIDHTNELVTLQARGRHAELFSKYAERSYPGTRIVDNTHIHAVMMEAATKGVKHIILFIGDGMNTAHEVAASRYLHGADNSLAWNSWGKEANGWAGFCTTWDVTTYNKYAKDRGTPPYDPARFDPAVGYDPRLGGTRPIWTLPDRR